MIFGPPKPQSELLFPDMSGQHHIGCVKPWRQVYANDGTWKIPSNQIRHVKAALNPPKNSRYVRWSDVVKQQWQVNEGDIIVADYDLPPQPRPEFGEWMQGLMYLCSLPRFLQTTDSK